MAEPPDDPWTSQLTSSSSLSSKECERACCLDALEGRCLKLTADLAFAEPPADELLAALEKKRKRGGRKKKAASLDEDVISDGEAIEQMGGWIECQRCCVASHFGCLSADQRSNLLKQVSLKTGEKQYTVEIGETSVSLGQSERTLSA